MNDKIEDKFLENIQKVFSDQLPKKIAVAVSGGCDSMALLLLLKNLLGNKTKIFCLTIDHCTRKSSAKDTEFVANFCQKHFINCTILKSYLPTPPDANIEHNLREMRYALLQEFCEKHRIKHLFVAHHRQDLAENFLIRLFRGSGIDGLASMGSRSELNNITIIRPLLDFNKDDLWQYLKSKSVNWIEDESNEDEKYLRNKIRNFLNSLPEKELINQRVALASKAIFASKKILEQETAKNFPKVFGFNDLGYFVLNIKKFLALDEGRATRYLALSLMKISGNIYKPRLEKLQKFYEIILAGELNKSKTFYGCVLEKLNNSEIIIYREKSAIKDVFLSTTKTNFDNRFIIKTTKDLIDRNIQISTLNPAQFNQIIKDNPSLKSLKNPLKKIFYTIPTFKIEDKIIAIPQINHYPQYDLKGKINIIYS